MDLDHLHRIIRQKVQAIHRQVQTIVLQALHILLKTTTKKDANRISQMKKNEIELLIYLYDINIDK